MADLCFEDGFRFLALADIREKELELGADAYALYEKLLDAEQFVGVIPVEAQAAIDGLPKDERRRIRPHNFASSTSTTPQTLAQATVKLEDIIDLQRNTLEYEHCAQHAESDWKNAIHSEVLRLALRRRKDAVLDGALHVSGLRVEEDAEVDRF
ncbi:hypothetical protein SLS58_009226 [Diplodia intermedia]|uniref:Uncharacterized protein n=1 Tax=Diplodia intermedia TaxID=856260 RepID=A0ABR3TDX4_9PEZI